MKLSSLVPRPIKRRLKATVRRMALGGAPLPTVLNYLAYEPRQDSFLIPRENSPDTEGSDPTVPPTHLWRGYGHTPEEYLASGAEHVGNMLRIVQESGLELSPGDRVLDFGCAAGRLIRQLDHLAESCELWGVDISAECIRWCRRHLDPSLRFVTTTSTPHLPFEDGYFDLIYAGSVFSHLDDLAEAWLLELRRLLSPRGRAYVTVNDERSIELLETRYRKLPVAGALLSNEHHRDPAGSLGMLVLRGGTSAHVFYGIDYFVEMAGAIFDVHSVTPEAYGFQTAVLLKRRRSRRPGVGDRALRGARVPV